MHIYIDTNYLLAGIIAVGGYCLGRYFLVRGISKRTEADINQFHFEYYRDLYNEQMGHLIAQYKQERVALIHRYENLTLELEHEIAVIRNALDSERTIRTHVETIEEALREDAV